MFLQDTGALFSCQRHITTMLDAFRCAICTPFAGRRRAVDDRQIVGVTLRNAAFAIKLAQNWLPYMLYGPRDKDFRDRP